MTLFVDYLLYAVRCDEVTGTKYHGTEYAWYEEIIHIHPKISVRNYNKDHVTTHQILHY